MVSGVDTSRIAQVAIVVRDLDTTLAAWKALLGIEPEVYLTTGTFDETGTEYAGQPTPARIKTACFRIGNFELELMQPIDGPSVWRDHLEQHGDGLHHLGFVSDRIEDGVASFEELGVPVIQRASYDNEYGHGRNVYFDSASVFGAMVELNEYGGETE